MMLSRTSCCILPILLLVGLGEVDATAQTPACRGLFIGGQPPRLVNPKLAQRTTFLCNQAYAVLASGVTHGALWSAEHPTAATLAEASRTQRENRFHPDDRLPPSDQAQLADYRRSGYDRGHMTPSGDMPGQAAQEESFSLANMVPQTPELNRGIWERIESSLRRRAEQEGELYLVTGPAFRDDQIKAIGPDGVLVPTSTWKAIYDPQARGSGVYVCKNTDQSTCDVVAVATLERVVGIDPFPALPEHLKQVALMLPLPAERRNALPESHRHRAPSGFLDRLLDWLLGS